jgi:hypothetical protein
MLEFILTLFVALGGVVFLQRRRISELENQAVDVKDEKLKTEQTVIQEKKEEVKQELVKVESKKVEINKDQSAEDYWKDKL